MTDIKSTDALTPEKQAGVCPPGPCPHRRCTCLARELAAVIRSAGPLAEQRAIWYVASVQRREASGRKPIPMPGDDPRWWQDHFDVAVRRDPAVPRPGRRPAWEVRA